MATITQNSLTLLELSKRQQRGSLLSMAEVLTKINEIFVDMPFVQANGDTVHKFTRRASLPVGLRRELNAGVKAQSSKATEHTAGIVLFEAFSEIDERVLKLSGDPKATRNSEALAFVEGISQTMATELWQGSKLTSPTGFDGFETQVASTTSPNGWCVQNHSAGVDGSNTSAWVIQWGPEKVFGIYPKGNTGYGLNHIDLGQETKRYTEDSVEKMYRIWLDQFTLDAGLVIKDPRCVGRLCNIGSGTTNTLDPKKLMLLLNKMNNIDSNTVIYCNRTLKYQLDVLAYDKSNGFYTAQNIFGQPVTMFRGIPIKLCEAILDTEATIS